MAGEAEGQPRLDLVRTIPQVALQAVAGEGGAGHRVAQDHARDRDDVLRLPPRMHLDDDSNDVGERRRRRDGQGDSGDPGAAGEWLSQA